MVYPGNFNNYLKSLKSNLKSVVGDGLQNIIMIPSAGSIARTVKKDRIGQTAIAWSGNGWYALIHGWIGLD